MDWVHWVNRIANLLETYYNLENYITTHHYSLVPSVSGKFELISLIL